MEDELIKNIFKELQLSGVYEHDLPVKGDFEYINIKYLIIDYKETIFNLGCDSTLEYFNKQ